MARDSAHMVEGVAARAQEDQLDGGTGTAIAPKALVYRGYITVGQREVALGIEFRQPGGQALLAHIAKFQARHLLPPVKVARSEIAGRYLTADTGQVQKSSSLPPADPYKQRLLGETARFCTKRTITPGRSAKPAPAETHASIPW